MELAPTDRQLLGLHLLCWTGMQIHRLVPRSFFNGPGKGPGDKANKCIKLCTYKYLHDCARACNEVNHDLILIGGIILCDSSPESEK